MYNEAVQGLQKYLVHAKPFNVVKAGTKHKGSTMGACLSLRLCVWAAAFNELAENRETQTKPSAALRLRCLLLFNAVRDFYFVGELGSGGSRVQEQEHLTCFVPGMLALGAFSAHRLQPGAADAGVAADANASPAAAAAAAAAR